MGYFSNGNANNTIQLSITIRIKTHSLKTKKHNMVNPNCKNIRYGELVELASLNNKRERSFTNSSGYHCGVKVHFFNRRGVLVGNVYEFVPYSAIRFRKDSPVYERHFMIKKGGGYENTVVEFFKMSIHKFYCKIITVLIRKTQFIW